MKVVAKAVSRSLAVLAVFLWIWPALGQTTQTAQANLQLEYDRLFQQMLRDPSNMDLMFEFAALANNLENYEAAIGTLERMLLINPDLPRVKLELGALYFRLDSYTIARR